MGYGAGETLGTTTGVVTGMIGLSLVVTGVVGTTTGVVSTGATGVVTGLEICQRIVSKAAFCSEGTRWSSTRQG